MTATTSHIHWCHLFQTHQPHTIGSKNSRCATCATHVFALSLPSTNKVDVQTETWVAEVGRCQVLHCHDLIPRPRGHVKFATKPHRQALLNIALLGLCIPIPIPKPKPPSPRKHGRELGGEASCSNLAAVPPLCGRAALVPGRKIDGMFCCAGTLPREGGGCVMGLDSLSCVKVTREIIYRRTTRRLKKGKKKKKVINVEGFPALLLIYGVQAHKLYTLSHSPSLLYRLLLLDTIHPPLYSLTSSYSPNRTSQWPSTVSSA